MIDKKLIGKTYKIHKYPSPDWDCKYSYDIREEKETSTHIWEIGSNVKIYYYDDDEDSEYYELRNESERYVTLEKLTEYQVKTMLNISTAEKSKTTKLNKEKDDEKMIKNNLFKEFGPITDDSVTLTLSGQIAVKINENEYMRYNTETKTMENQMDLVIKEASELIYIMPVNSVEIGDIIKNKESYYQILEIEPSGNLKTVKIKDGSKKTMIKETNILGFSFYYKVISLFSGDGMNNKTSNGIDPMMLMMLSDKEEDNENDNNLLPLMLMSNINNQSDNKNAMNPMMLMMMLKNKGKNSNGFNMKDFMMMQMMSGGINNQQLNPMMLMMMGDGEMDMKTLMLMNMLNTGNKQSDNGNSENK